MDHAAIEVAAEAAVPSKSSMPIGGRWRAHFSSGHIRRINSVAMHGERVTEDVAVARLHIVLDVYAERGLRPRLRVTTMDSWIEPLISRWSEAGEALVMTAAPAPGDLGETISVTDWLGWLAPRASSPGRLEEAASSARCLTSDHVIVTASSNGEVIGAARAVSTNGMTGLFDITVDAEHRRRGHARSMMHRLMGWAENRSEPVYLQVAAVNRPAITLYESMGFVERYRYRYRSPD